MMFGLSSHRLPSVSSYAKALQLWEKSKPLKSLADDPLAWRFITRYGDGSKTVHRDEHGVIRFKYHRTVMVTYWGPALVEVAHHDTPSSATFANAFLPSGLFASMVRGVMYVNGHRPKESSLRWVLKGGEWVPEDITKVHRAEKPLVDRKYANYKMALKKVKDIETLSKVRLALGAPFKPAPHDLRNAVQCIAEMVEKETFETASEAELVALCGAQYRIAILLGTGCVAKRLLPPGHVPRPTPYDSVLCFARRIIQD